MDSVALSDIKSSAQYSISLYFAATEGLESYWHCTQEPKVIEPFE
jgi:hypothetical protein